MGRYKQGILGSFSGKVGAVIGSSWKGINYMRGLARPTTRQPSAEQLAQRARFSLAVGFLKPAMQLVTLGFRYIDSKKTGYNVALAKMLDESTAVITGTYPDFEIDYAKIQVSERPVAPAESPVLTSPGPGQVRVAWGPSAGNNMAGPDDRAMLLLYDAASGRHMATTAGEQRSVQLQAYDLPEFTGSQVHVWIAFIAANGKKVSSSVYAGVLAVS